MRDQRHEAHVLVAEPPLEVRVKESQRGQSTRCGGRIAPRSILVNGGSACFDAGVALEVDRAQNRDGGSYQ